MIFSELPTEIAKSYKVSAITRIFINKTKDKIKITYMQEVAPIKRKEGYYEYVPAIKITEVWNKEIKRKKEIWIKLFIGKNDAQIL